jgi:hypothetical protein
MGQFFGAVVVQSLFVAGIVSESITPAQHAVVDRVEVEDVSVGASEAEEWSDQAWGEEAGGESMHWKAVEQSYCKRKQEADGCLVGGEVGEVEMMIAVKNSSALASGCSKVVKAIQHGEEDTVHMYVHFHDLWGEAEVEVAHDEEELQLQLAMAFDLKKVEVATCCSRLCLLSFEMTLAAAMIVADYFSAGVGIAADYTLQAAVEEEEAAAAAAKAEVEVADTTFSTPLCLCETKDNCVEFRGTTVIQYKK